MDLQLGGNSSEEEALLATDRGETGLLRELAAARSRIIELEARLAGQARVRAELVNLVCHELRTPITVISGFSRLLQNEVSGTLNCEQHRFVREGLKACQRLDRFVGDLLEARPEAETPFAVVVEEADLHETIEGQLESLLPLLEERNLKVEARLRSRESILRFDARRIEQVISNLMTNAIRYGPASGVIRLETHLRDTALGATPHSSIEVSVEDDGPGIPAADRERLFAPYVRGDHGEDAVGLGIGLAISRRIIDAHGGRIWIEAGELGGARFVFSLPRRRRAGRED
ncbi:MAG: HAMP domain-containing histidine kinase [bacterium]|nr:hypothetical protein [Deltaproteobacteria bacterium]MCP4905560.1 HAMP domain-containing histidine kinase [bacterium]